MIIVNRARAGIVNTAHGSEIRPLIDRTTSGVTQCSLAEETLPPGCAVTPHHHRDIEEIYYIVSGSGLMTVGDETREVEAGDATPPAVPIVLALVHASSRTHVRP